MDKTKKLPPLEKLLALIKKGISQAEIAQMYGVSRQAVSKKLKLNSNVS